MVIQSESVSVVLCAGSISCNLKSIQLGWKVINGVYENKEQWRETVLFVGVEFNIKLLDT